MGRKRNKVNFQGKDYTINELAERFNINQATLKNRLSLGMDLELALVAPVQKNRKPITYQGKTYESKAALAREFGMHNNVYRLYRIGDRYATIEDAISNKSKQQPDAEMSKGRLVAAIKKALEGVNLAESFWDELVTISALVHNANDHSISKAWTEVHISKVSMNKIANEMLMVNYREIAK